MSIFQDRANWLSYVGKRMHFTVKSGAMYAGIFKGVNRHGQLVVGNLWIINSAGGVTSPKGGETRRFALWKITSYTF